MWSRRWFRLFGVGFAAVLCIFVVVNLVLYGLYTHKTYPNTQVAGKHLGSVPYRDLPQELKALELWPDKLTLEYESKQTVLSPEALGLSLDMATLTQTVEKNYWLPVVNLVQHRDVPLALRVDDQALSKQLALLADAHKEQPTDARIVLENDAFTLIKAKDGKTLDIDASKQAIVSDVSKGQQTLYLVRKNIPPKTTDDHLLPTLTKLQAQQNTPISYIIGGKKTAAAPSDITGWYTEKNGSYTLSDPAIKAYLVVAGKQYKVQVTNLPQAVAATKQALDQTKPLEFAVTTTPYTPAKTFSYCTATKGVAAGLAAELKHKLALTLADERGWTLGGAIDFVYTDKNCDFTVWLSAADQMASFGAICDSNWSCNVGRNVVINFDRWRFATSTWNATGGNLEDYRSMAINHETGHWLDFRHKSCGRPGQAAPVMQQQSIDLQGCIFNPWPLASEQAELRTRLRL